MSKILACWTKFGISLTRTIEDASSEDGMRWRVASNIRRDRWPDYSGQFYGCVVESPETVWHVTGWSTAKSLDRYENSLEWSRQREAQAPFSIAPLESYRCEVDNRFWSFIGAHVGFLDVFFPSSISRDDRETVATMPGLKYLHHLGRLGPFVTRHSRGWISQTHEYDGNAVVVMRFWHYWRDENCELHCKAEEPDATQEQQNRERHYRRVFNGCLKRLKDAGALGTREFHLTAEVLWDCYAESQD